MILSAILECQRVEKSNFYPIKQPSPPGEGLGVEKARNMKNWNTETSACWVLWGGGLLDHRPQQTPKKKRKVRGERERERTRQWMKQEHLPSIQWVVGFHFMLCNCFEDDPPGKSYCSHAVPHEGKAWRNSGRKLTVSTSWRSCHSFNQKLSKTKIAWSK